MRLRWRRAPFGDGDHYLLNGRKLWITNAREAEIFIVFATIDPAAGYKGITAFIVERGFPGFTVGRKEDKLGIRASSTCELLLDDCECPRRTCSATPGKGYKVAIETLNEGRIGIGAQMVGIAQGALDARVGYMKERRQFGKAVAEFQGVQFQLARAATDVEAARLMVYNAARLRDAGRVFPQRSRDGKLFASEVAERVDLAGRELYGGYGFVEGLPGRKVLPRRQDRPDLRGDVEHAAADDREATAHVGFGLRASGLMLITSCECCRR